MKNYRLYDVTDFVIDEDFIRWNQYKEAGDNEFWKSWLDNNPDKHLVVAEARRIVELMPGKVTQLPGKSIDAEVDQLLATIRHSDDEQAEGSGRQSSVILRWRYAVAAAAVLVVAAGLFFFRKQTPVSAAFTYATVTSSKNLKEYKNITSKEQQVNLPDGSVIQLSQNSKISYAVNFDSLPTRDIYLSGEAFFKVAKNPHRPFRVFANEIVTKVLGTSFTVRSFDADTLIKITVRTGKVSVYDQQSTDAVETDVPYKLSGMIVTPNQQLVYQRTRQKFQKVLLDNPIMLKSRSDKGEILYEETPVEKVFNDLTKSYGINIVFDADAVSDCTISADLSNESFYQKLDLICKAVGAQYRVAEGEVVIVSNGCK